MSNPLSWGIWPWNAWRAEYRRWYDENVLHVPYSGDNWPHAPMDYEPSELPFYPYDDSPPWAFPDDPHGVDTWDFSGGSGGGKKRRKRGKPGKRGRGQQMSRSQRGRARKPKPVRVRPQAGGGNAGKATQPYPTASQATGGAQPLRDLDALGEVGLTPLLAELVNHGSVSLATTLTAWQREQDRITNRTWRRPGGLYRPAGL